jgi:penicillin-binding protein 2
MYEESNPTAMRTRLLRLGLVIAFFLLSLQAWRLQIVEGRAYREQADHNRMRITTIPPLRGIIYDRNGNILAANTPAFVVSVIPTDLPRDREAEVLQRLAGILAMDVEPIRQAVQQGRSEGDAFTPVVVRRGVDESAVQQIEEQHPRLPGVVVQPEAVRYYPEGPLLAHVLGYLGALSPEEYERQRRLCGALESEQRRKECYNPNDRVGVAGLERQYERELRGVPGQRLSEVDASGRTVRELREEPPEPGYNLVLTLDLDLQREVEQALRDGMHGSPSAVAIVMRPTTGEILALVSLPSYDNNVFASGGRDSEIEALLNDPNRPLFNRAIAGQYPPGSTFKLVTAAAALHEHIADRNTIIESRGAILVPNEYNPQLLQRFPDWAVLGRMNFVQGLAYSSDVYFYYLGGGFENFRGLGNERLAAYARQFGYGARTGIDLPDEAEGIVPDERWKEQALGERWVKGDTYNMAIGQGFVAATPLQVAVATNAFANGGVLYRPHLVRAIVDQEGRPVREFGPQVIRTLPLSPEHWALIREGMEAGYTISPLLRHVRIPGLRVAGKTGTAEFHGPRNERGELPTHGWYTGFAPADKPEIAVTVFVERGSGSTEAAPIAAQIFRKYFRLAEAPAAPAPVLPPPPPAPGPQPPAPTPGPTAAGGATATPPPVPTASPAPTAPPAAPTRAALPAVPTLGAAVTPQVLPPPGGGPGMP